jgi:hypothetical protein
LAIGHTVARLQHVPMNATAASVAHIISSTLIVSLDCNTHQPVGPAPVTIIFLGFYIATMTQYLALHVYAFTSSIVSAYVNNTGAVYISNVVQDSDTTSIPYPEWVTQLCRIAIENYGTVAPVFELQIAFLRGDFLITFIVGRLLFLIYLTHLFMDEKRVYQLRAYERLKQQEMRQVYAHPQTVFAVQMHPAPEHPVHLSRSRWPGQVRPKGRK